NPVDEVAVEEALRLKEAHGADVTVVTIGPEAALTKAARRALSMGCDRAVHLSDPLLHGSDAEAIAYALACVLRHLSSGALRGANEPRYPSFKGIQSAKSKPVESLTAADVGIEASRVGLAGSRSQVLGFGARSTERRRILIDNKDGTAHVKLADFLQEAKLI